MIDRNTTLGQLMEMTGVLEQEHGELQGIVIHRNGKGRCYYKWRNFAFDVSPNPPPEIPPPNDCLKDRETRRQLTELQPGKAIPVDSEKHRNRLLTMARRIGVKLASRKQAEGGWMMWRVA